VSTVSTTAARLSLPALPSLALSRPLTRRLALTGIFLIAFGYQALQSIGHRTPLVFDDELLYTKLSQSIAEGHGLSIWGHSYFFPAPLAPLVQAPVWLLGSGGSAYFGARLLNAALMAAAVVPAYLIARRLVRTEWAVLTGLAAVALPSLGYHDTLMAEPLAYLVFLATVAAMLSAVIDESRWARAAVPVLCLLAIATRLQLVVLPFAYVVAVAVCARRRRAHLVPILALVVPAVGLGAVRGAHSLGQYNGVFHLSLTPGGVAHWGMLIGTLLPFSIGLAVLPGSLLGLFARPRNQAEKAFATLTLVLSGTMLLEAATIAAGEAQRPMERYVFYVAPLWVLAFFLYAERGAPRRLLYATIALAGGLAAVRLPFDHLLPPGSLAVDTPTASAFGHLEYVAGVPTAMLAVELGALATGILVAALPLRRNGAVAAVAGLSIALSTVVGVGYYRADHLYTKWVVDKLALPQLEFVDRKATYLSLPVGESAPTGQSLPDGTVQIWNRNIVRVAHLGFSHGHLPSELAAISRDGRLLIGGRPNEAGVFVIGNYGSRLGLEGTVLRRENWLTELRAPAGAHVRWYAFGLTRRGVTEPTLRYQAWPADSTRPGRFVLRADLPPGMEAMRVRATSSGGAETTVIVRRGAAVTISLPAPAGNHVSLLVRVSPANAKESMFRPGVRVLALSYRTR
jgi:hypothetical protein